MSEIEKLGEVLDFHIGKLQLSHDDILVIKTPENWTPRQVAMYGHYLTDFLKDHKDPRLRDIAIMVFPAGVELDKIEKP
jgi:hypothetical protein